MIPTVQVIAIALLAIGLLPIAVDIMTIAVAALGCMSFPAFAQERAYGRAERQPHMYNALSFLEQAENELQAASRDKGGYGREALAAVKRAQREVRRGIRYDERH